MSLTHCPLCLGLALLSLGRATAHLILLVALVSVRQQSSGNNLPSGENRPTKLPGAEALALAALGLS